MDERTEVKVMAKLYQFPGSKDRGIRSGFGVFNESQDPGELIELAAHDGRITRLVVDRLGVTPVGGYVATALRSCRGSYIVASLILDALAPFVQSASSVVLADVERLGVHLESDDRIGLVSTGLRAQVFNVEHKVRQLQLQFIHDPNYVPTTLGRLTGQRPPPRPGSSDDPQDVNVYLRIYLCALAMLVGVKADPRSIAA